MGAAGCQAEECRPGICSRALASGGSPPRSARHGASLATCTRPDQQAGRVREEPRTLRDWPGWQRDGGPFSKASLPDRPAAWPGEFPAPAGIGAYHGPLVVIGRRISSNRGRVLAKGHRRPTLAHPTHAKPRPDRHQTVARWWWWGDASRAPNGSTQKGELLPATGGRGRAIARQGNPS